MKQTINSTFTKHDTNLADRSKRSHSKIKNLPVLAQESHLVNKKCSRCYCTRHCANSADYVGYWFQGTHSLSCNIIIKQSPILWTSDRKVSGDSHRTANWEVKTCGFKRSHCCTHRKCAQPEAAPEISALKTRWLPAAAGAGACRAASMWNKLH